MGKTVCKECGVGVWETIGGGDYRCFHCGEKQRVCGVVEEEGFGFTDWDFRGLGLCQGDYDAQNQRSG